MDRMNAKSVGQRLIRFRGIAKHPYPNRQSPRRQTRASTYSRVFFNLAIFRNENKSQRFSYVNQTPIPYTIGMNTFLFYKDSEIHRTDNRRRVFPR